MALRGLQVLYNLILKDIVKGSGQASGIMSIGKDVRKLADRKLQSYITAAKRQGVDLDSLSEQEIKYMLELNKPKPIRAIAADSPEGQGITRDLFNMLDRRSGKNVIKTDFGKPFAEEIGSVDNIIKNIKTMKPIDSMKETNRVLRGEGKYKNLSKADREKIVNDESVTDHIFERNIIDETEDFAGGGVAGLLGERPGYQDGNLVQTMYPIGNFLNIRANAPTQKDYNIQATKDLVENLPGGVVRDVFAPAAAGVMSLPYDAIQAATRTTQSDIDRAMQTGALTPRDITSEAFGLAYDRENPLSTAIERSIGAAGPLADRFNQEEEDEYDFSDIEGQTAMLDPFSLIGLIKSGVSAKGVGKTLLKNKLQEEIGKKIVRPKIIKKLKESAGVEFGGTEKFKNISTSNKNYGPYKKSTAAEEKAKAADAAAAAKAKADAAHFARQRRIQSYGPHITSREDKSGRGQRGGFTNPGKGSYGPHMALGGIARQNFKMGKRAFLKLMGGAAAGIGALKTGALSMFGKKAAPVATEVVKSAGSGTTPPPYFFNLVNKIKNLGDDVTPKYAVQERQRVTRYKDYELTEDVATGEKTIQRVKMSDDGPQYYDETLAEETYMNYKPGKGQMDETTKGKTPPDEYTEDTSYLRTSGPSKGEIYDTVEGVADDVIEEGTMFEDNITKFGKKITKTKKASGGLAYMVGE